MEDKSPAEKAWRTMKSKSPGIKAAYTKRRKQGAKKAAAKVKSKQWEPEKVEFLNKLKTNAIPNTCAVCGDSRPVVLQVHHVDTEKKIEITLCANCHDIVRRGTFEDLKKAHKGNKNESK
jgi:sulfur relay (sulfurtransferase) complex TusBCD TusD component (DsrE family)